MAVFSGPKIVNDGIVLHLDAVNTRSVPDTSFTWRDLSRRGNNALLRNAPSVLSFKDLPARARALRAFAFNGTDQFTEIPRSDDFDFGSGDLTIEYWLYMESYNSEGNVPVIKTQSNATGGIAVGHFISSSGALTMYASDNSSYTVNASGGTISLNQWHHICLTRIGSTWTTYLDTEVVSTATWSGSVSHDTSGDYGGIGIGAYTNAYGGDAGSYSTDGRFSGVKIYKGRGLTVEEVQQNYYAKVARHVRVPTVATATETVELYTEVEPIIDYLIVAGGGGGTAADDNYGAGGGGGAGGLISASSQTIQTGVEYTIVVGAGGAGTIVNPNFIGVASISSNGENTTAFGNTAIGGGCGGGPGSGSGSTAAASGGSGGGGFRAGGAAGTTGQGNAGGSGSGGNGGGGGGGGAGSVGGNQSGGNGGAGGSGLEWPTGSGTYYAGGGGGGAESSRSVGSGGIGGGGDGGDDPNPGYNGTANTGGGGGGGGVDDSDAGSQGFGGGNGGSGVVIIRTELTAASTTGSPTVTQDGSINIYTFTGSGSITF